MLESQRSNRKKIVYIRCLLMIQCRRRDREAESRYQRVQPKSIIIPSPYGRKSYFSRMRGSLSVDASILSCEQLVEAEDDDERGFIVAVDADKSLEDSSFINAITDLAMTLNVFLGENFAKEACSRESCNEDFAIVEVFVASIVVILMPEIITFLPSRSISSLRRWMLRYSQCVTLEGSNILLNEKSHQHRSMVRMTSGKGLS